MAIAIHYKNRIIVNISTTFKIMNIGKIWICVKKSLEILHMKDMEVKLRTDVEFYLQY